MSKSTIELNSGSVIHREPLEGYDEQWRIENKSLSTCFVTLDISNCSGISIDGHEGETEITESANAMEEVILFVIRKNPPFSFKIGFNVKEEPISIQEQEDILNQGHAERKARLDRLGEGLLNVPFEVMDDQDIETQVKALDFDHFVDPVFRPNDNSIYDPDTVDSYPLSEKAVWKRPTEYMTGTPHLFVNDPDPNDIRQGALGNCWFLASLAALAESPALVKRLFITNEYNDFGIYKLRICKNGEWVVVTIDDYIPCYYSGGPMFSSGNGNELWVMLIEKAYAKLHGNYWQLRAGFVAHGMMDLSGCPTQRYNFPAERTDYNSILDFADRFWDVLVEGDRAGWIMCAGTPGVDVYTEGGGPNDEFGIVPGHAYSVIAANEYKNVRLLNVRNPWGQFEWGGKWSDKDKASWTPDFVQAIKPDFDVQDGSFWIEYDDFFKYYESLTVCKIENWRELRLKGKFIKAEEMQSGNQTVISQFYYSLKLENSAHIELGIHQEDERIFGAERRPYLDLSLIILKREDDGTLSLADIVEMKTVREAQKGIDFDPGHYIIVPRTTGAVLQKTSNEYLPLPIKIKRGEKMHLNPEVYSSIMDVFRKIDLKLDSILSARELNYFGDAVNEPYFQNLTPESFETKEFDRISCTYEGGKIILCLINFYSYKIWIYPAFRRLLR